MKLSPQKQLIVSTLRNLKWHCGREWLNQIKDDRKRISELNSEYMAEKGYEILGEPCKGTICGKEGCPLFKRKAVPLPKGASEMERQVMWFDSLPDKLNI